MGHTGVQKEYSTSLCPSVERRWDWGREGDRGMGGQRGNRREEACGDELGAQRQGRVGAGFAPPCARDGCLCRVPACCLHTGEKEESGAWRVWRCPWCWRTGHWEGDLRATEDGLLGGPLVDSQQGQRWVSLLGCVVCKMEFVGSQLSFEPSQNTSTWQEGPALPSLHQRLDNSKYSWQSSLKLNPYSGRGEAWLFWKMHLTHGALFPCGEWDDEALGRASPSLMVPAAFPTAGSVGTGAGP